MHKNMARADELTEAINKLNLAQSTKFQDLDTPTKTTIIYSKNDSICESKGKLSTYSIRTDGKIHLRKLELKPCYFRMP